jgi:hypothetical protein
MTALLTPLQRRIVESATSQKHRDGLLSDEQSPEERMDTVSVALFGEVYWDPEWSEYVKWLSELEDEMDHG